MRAYQTIFANLFYISMPYMFWTPQFLINIGLIVCPYLSGFNFIFLYRDLLLSQLSSAVNLLRSQLSSAVKLVPHSTLLRRYPSFAVNLLRSQPYLSTLLRGLILTSLWVLLRWNILLLLLADILLHKTPEPLVALLPRRILILIPAEDDEE